MPVPAVPAHAYSEPVNSRLVTTGRAEPSPGRRFDRNADRDEGNRESPRGPTPPYTYVKNVKIPQLGSATRPVKASPRAYAKNVKTYGPASSRTEPTGDSEGICRKGPHRPRTDGLAPGAPPSVYVKNVRMWTRRSQNAHSRRLRTCPLPVRAGEYPAQSDAKEWPDRQWLTSETEAYGVHVNVKGTMAVAPLFAARQHAEGKNVKCR